LKLDEIPCAVTIDEAVEIAKKYGTEDSGAFVNAILDRIMKETHCEDRKVEKSI